jgi:hypothetical protein
MQLSSNAHDVEQDFCIKLVQAVGKYPCLYNYELSDYSRKNVVDKSWVEVGKEVNEGKSSFE